MVVPLSHSFRKILKPDNKNKHAERSINIVKMLLNTFKVMFLMLTNRTDNNATVLLWCPQCQTAHPSGDLAYCTFFSPALFVVLLYFKSWMQGGSAGGVCRHLRHHSACHTVAHMYPTHTRVQKGKGIREEKAWAWGKKKTQKYCFTVGEDGRGAEIWKDSDQLHAVLQKRSQTNSSPCRKTHRNRESERQSDASEKSQESQRQ